MAWQLPQCSVTSCTQHLLTADDSDVTDQPIRIHVRGSSSAVEYAKKSFSLDPVDQITNFTDADTEGISFLGRQRCCAFSPACCAGCKRLAHQL